MSRPRLDEILAALVRGGPDATRLTLRLCRDCVEHLPITAAVLTLRTGNSTAMTLAASDEGAGRLDALQFALGEGPGPDVDRGGAPVLVSELDVRGVRARWPTYVPEALAAGVRAVFSYPLRVGAISLGVLTLTSETAGSMTEDHRAGALTYAEAATALLLHLQQLGEGDHAANGLHAEVALPFESSAEVHQATGMISVQAGVSMAEALLLLRGRAFALGLTPVLLARDVVARRVTFGHRNGHDG